MSLQIEDDPDRVGFAILRLQPPRTGPLAVSIQFLEGTYLGPDGRRTRERHLFPAEPHTVPGAQRLGPSVTAHVPDSEVVTLADGDGVKLGTVAWEGIRPPRQIGRGALVGDAGRLGASADRTAGFATDVAAVPPTEATESKTEVSDPPTLVGPLPRPAARRRLAPLATLLSCAVLISGLLWAGLVLSGRIGWVVERPNLRFNAASDGPATPPDAETLLRPLWYARPFAALVTTPFMIEDHPEWLVLGQDKAAGLWRLHTSIESAARNLPSGDNRHRVPVRFPLGGTGAGLSVDVAVHVAAPPPPLPQALPVAAPEPAAPLSPVDDVACDRAAGSRFDPDHPAGSAFVDDSFVSTPEVLENGIASCDPRTDRTGPDRRFLVQRGRLLAAHALLRAAAGELPAAQQEMDEAVAAWRVGSAQGSAFADSLLGAYAFGTYNRLALTFVQPDDAAAVRSWAQGMARGSVVAQRNYATQLLAGRGIAAAPSRALDLLRDALARGDERAAGVLGVALYTGYPSGVPADKAQGWSLVVKAQCLDKASADLLGAEVQRGAQSEHDRKACP